MPKLSFRDILWLTLVVGIGIIWWLDHQHVTRYGSKKAVMRFMSESNQLREALEQRGYKVTIDERVDYNSVTISP